MLEDAADRRSGHQPWQQEVERQRNPDGEEVEEEASEEPAHVTREEYRGGRDESRPPRSPGGGRYCPALPPGQICVKERRLSGKVVKIGSPKWFFGESKQWKYFVL